MNEGEDRQVLSNTKVQFLLTPLPTPAHSQLSYFPPEFFYSPYTTTFQSFTLYFHTLSTSHRPCFCRTLKSGAETKKHAGIWKIPVLCREVNSYCTDSIRSANKVKEK